MTRTKGSKFAGGAISFSKLSSGGFHWLAGHSREGCRSGLNVAEFELEDGIEDTNSDDDTVLDSTGLNRFGVLGKKVVPFSILYGLRAGVFAN